MTLLEITALIKELFKPTQFYTEIIGYEEEARVNDLYINIALNYSEFIEIDYDASSETSEIHVSTEDCEDFYQFPRNDVYAFITVMLPYFTEECCDLEDNR